MATRNLVNSPVDVDSLLYPIIYRLFLIHPSWLFGISEPSTVVHGVSWDEVTWFTIIHLLPTHVRCGKSTLRSSLKKHQASLHFKQVGVCWHFVPSIFVPSMLIVPKIYVYQFQIICLKGKNCPSREIFPPRKELFEKVCLSGGTFSTYQL